MKAPKTKPKPVKAKPTKSGTKRKVKPRKPAVKKLKKVRVQRTVRTTKAVAAARGKLPVAKPTHTKPQRDVVVPTKPKTPRKPKSDALPTMEAFQKGLQWSGACDPARSHYRRHGLRRGYETMELGYFAWAAWRFYGVKRTRALFKAVVKAVGRDLYGEPWNFSGAGVEKSFDDFAKANRAEARQIAESILPFKPLMRRIAKFR